VRIEMAAPHVFRGHVVDERGRPVVGARLSRSAQQGWSSNGATHVPGLSLWQASAMEGTSDAAGGFELGPYSYERTSVRVEHPEHPFVDLPIDALRPDNELVVPTGGVLHGTVTGCDGRPAVGARVSVGSGTQGRASTDGAGRFELRGLKAAEEAFVHVEAAGNALFALQPLRIARGENELALVLAPPKVLAGRVVDAAGAAVVDARVHIEGDRLVHYVDIDHGEKTTWEWFAGRNEVRTDRRGAFRFADLYDGEFALSVHPEGLPGRRAHVRARAGEEALEIVLGAGAPSLGFVGTVRDARTGAAIEEFTFYVERPDDVPEPDASARVDFENGTIEIVIIESWTGTPAAVERESNGAFRVTGLDPGHLRVQIAAEGYVPFQGEARDHGPGEVVLHARLVPACTLRVEVGDPSEVQGNTTTLRFEDLDGRTLLYGSSHNRHSDLHVRAPSVAVEGLPCGPVRLRASRSGCRDLELDLDLATLGDEPVRLCMQRER
jgi:protocatechuate 3,4-dioxygenase beta subunit